MDCDLVDLIWLDEWIRDLIRLKQIKAVKIGQWKINPKDLEKFIKSRRNY